MSIFYAIMCIVFAVFTYYISLENETPLKERLLTSFIMLILWPFVMIVITTYLIVMHTRKAKQLNEMEGNEEEWTKIETDTETSEDTEETS